MIRRPASYASALTGIGLAAVFAAGCGSATVTASPIAAQTIPSTPIPTPTATTTPASLPSASGSASPSVSPSASQDLGLPHVNAALEDKLPGVIGGITLEKFSMPLSTYMASSNGGDKILYTPWLVKFGKSPDQIDLAVAADLTQTENFFLQAIQVPGVDAAALTGEFANVARAAKWPVAPPPIELPKSVLEIVDPAANAAGGLGTAYVYAKGDIMYVIVTDNLFLVVEALSKLP